MQKMKKLPSSMETVMYRVVLTFCLTVMGLRAGTVCAQTSPLSPLDDSYVESGTGNTNTNFGTSNNLMVKYTTSGTETRKTFLRFDFTGIPAVTSAKIWIYQLANTNGAGTEVDLWEVNDTNPTWSQSTVTWANQPNPINSLIASTTIPTTAGWYSWDITTWLTNELTSGAISNNGDYHHSFVLQTSTATTNPLVFYSSNYATSEPPNTGNPSGNSSYKPQLTFTIPTPGVPTMTPSSNSTSQITLTLAEGSPAGSTYTLFRSETGGFTPLLCTSPGVPTGCNSLATGITGTTYNDTALTAGTRYYYRAESVSPGGTSALTAEAYSTTYTQLNPGVAILMEPTDFTNSNTYWNPNQVSGSCPANATNTPVMNAVCDLQRDLNNVFGQTSAIYTSEAAAPAGVPLIVVTHPFASHPLGTLGYVDSSLSGTEAHELSLLESPFAPTSPQRMVLQGTDIRGTMYAIYQFSDEFLGVPPLYYWTGWLQSHTQLSNVVITHNYTESFASPAVLYRGMYPGDTDLLVPWMNLTAANSAAYFETYLRLKFNTMDVGSISDVPDTVKYSNSAGPSPNSGLQYAETCAQRGLIVTFTHTSPFGANFSDWQRYWNWTLGGNNTTIGANPPAYTDTTNMEQFWKYYLGLPATYGITDLIETLAFRGENDEPWWLYVTGDPNPNSFSQFEATQIATQLTNQLGLLQNVYGNSARARIIFYNESQVFMADRIAGGFTFNVPSATNGGDTNLIWSFANTQRDNNPGTDLEGYSQANFSSNYATQQTGYYENPEFSNTGAHISSAEGPWKLEDSQRFVMSQSAPNMYTMAILNMGNFREFTVEASAAAALLWNPTTYGNTNTYLTNFATKYFGATHASTIEGLFQQYYNAFWQTASNDFTAGPYSPTGTQFPNEYPFQDGRYSQGALLLMDNIGAKCSAAAGGACANQFASHTGGRYNDGADYYNIIAADTNNSANETDAMIYGTNQAISAFNTVATNCVALQNATGLLNYPYLMDSLCTHAQTMRELNTFVNALANASRIDTGPTGPINTDLMTAQTALTAWLNGSGSTPSDLAGRQQGIFASWYSTANMSAISYTDLSTDLSNLLTKFPAQ